MGVLESSSIMESDWTEKSWRNSPSMIISENHLVSNTNYYKILYSVVVSSISYFHIFSPPIWEKIPIWTHIFHMGWFNQFVFLLKWSLFRGFHPGRLIWNLQITHLERKMIFQTPMIMFHVNLQGCILDVFFFVFACSNSPFIEAAKSFPIVARMSCTEGKWYLAPSALATKVTLDII